MEEGNIFDDLKMSKQSSDALSIQNGEELDSQNKNQKLAKEKDDKTITLKIEDLQELVDNIKLKHRAEIDAIMTEQGVYRRIISSLIKKLKHQQLSSDKLE